MSQESIQEALNQKELEQEQRLDTWRKLGQMIVLKHLVLAVVVFMVFFCISFYLIRRYRLTLHDRFTAKAMLVYYPKHSGKIKTFEDRQVMQFLSRRQTALRVAEEMGLSSKDIASVVGNIKIEYNKSKANIFTLIAKGASKNDAVTKVNTFADICIREYIALRTKDLEKWEETIQIRKKELQETTAKIEREDSELGIDIGIRSPEDELDRLNKSIMDHKLLLSNVNVQYLRAKGLKEAKEALLKESNLTVLPFIGKINSFVRELSTLDREIKSLQELFTEQNPKLKAKKNLRDNLQKEFDAFKKVNNITVFDPTVLDKLEKAYREVQDSISNLEKLVENKTALEREIATEEAAIKKMQEVIPKSKQLRQQRIAVAEAQKELELLTSDINYQLASMKNDLTLLEPAESAMEEPLMNVKLLVYTIFIAGTIMGTLLIIICSIELVFGFIQEREVDFYPELSNLGYLPSKRKKFSSPEQEKMVLDSIFYVFEQKCSLVNIVFLSVLPGASFHQEVIENFEWNYAMSGKKMLVLFVVPAKDFVPLTGSTELCVVSYEGMVGSLPVENPATLLPSELQMLQQDISVLRDEFDGIFIVRKEPLDKVGVFFSQMLSFCDSAILLVGIRHTKRSMLRYVIEHQRTAEKTMMTIAVNSRDMDTVVNGEA